MTSWLKKTAIFSLTIGILLPYASLYAAEFNPNYLISDEEMQNWRSMNRSDIDGFLTEKGGYISTLQIEDKDGKVRTVPDIIWRAARDHRINPKYLLVKLQKEQSLVTEADPTQKQLDGATGYGITDGCGWSCETYLNNKGFGKQVDSAAGIMRWYYDHVNTEGWIKRPHVVYAIDRTPVKPVNNATAFLYTYTPHIEGNKNFFTLWQKWFAQVYPDGTLVKQADDPTVYLLEQNTKRAFTSLTAFNTRFDQKMIVTIPETELAKYETGTPISLPNYAILKHAEQYYLLDYDTLRPFENQGVLTALGYHPDEIITVSDADIAGFGRGTLITATSSAPLGELLKIKESGNLYYKKEGVLHPLFDETIAKMNFPHLSKTVVSNSTIQHLKQGDPIPFKDGILIQLEGSNKVYVIEHGKKLHIASEEVFNAFGFDWKNIHMVNQFVGMLHPTGAPLSTAPTQIAQVATAPSDLSKPTQTAPSSDVMVRVSEADTVYMGEKFETPLNTYLVAEYETGTILAGKNIDVVRPLASFAKLMTAHRLMREGIRLQTTTTYEANNHKAIYHKFRVAEGEKIYNKDLFDAMLISSLNTPAKMLVGSIEKNESEFIARMNREAQELGLTHTTFADVAGEKIKTVGTAREYAILFKKVLNNSTIEQTLGKEGYEYVEYKDTDGKPNHFDTHTNELMEKIGLPFTIIASKTGYLDEAGAGLVMLIERNTDNKKFIIISMGNPDYTNRFEEPQGLTMWALGRF